MENWMDIGYGIGHAALLLGIALVVLFLIKVIADRITPFDDEEEIERENNVAYALARAGLYVAVTLGMAGALAAGPAETFAQEALLFAIDGLVLGIATLVSQGIVRKIVLPGEKLTDELVSKNVAAGVIEFAISLAIGLVAFGSFARPGAEQLSGVIYIALGIVLLGATVKLLERFAKVGMAEIRAGNLPAAVLLGAQIVSTGILLQMAINGPVYVPDESVTITGPPPETLGLDLINMVLWFAVGFLFNLVASFLIDLLFLPKSAKVDWIRENRLAPALLQGATQIGLAGLVAAVL